MTDGSENDEVWDRAVRANFATDRETNPILSNPNTLTYYSTGPLVGPAKEEKIGKRLFNDTVKAEQRAKFLQSLVVAEVGTNRVESNQLRARGELKRDSGVLLGTLLLKWRERLLMPDAKPRK